jgi:hypothetical protein
MMNTRGYALLFAALFAFPVSVPAQVRASEPAVVGQTVNGTTITVTYARPRVRGRSPVYGKVVTWGEVWTPGANWATTLEVDKDVTVNGHPLSKGKYSVWMEVQPKEWTVIFDRKAKAFHTNHPKPDSTQVRFPVAPAKSDGPEVLTWSFPAVSPTGTTLQMAWAGRAVSLQITVPPSHPMTLAADLAPRYTGSYAFHWVESDTTKADSAPPPPTTWTVNYTNGRLLVDWVPPPFEEWAHLVLIRVADDWFYPGVLQKGELYDVSSDLIIEFTLKDGRATGFDIRVENDEVIGKGVRTE